MRLRDKFGHYARFSAGVSDYLRAPAQEDSLAPFQRQMEGREEVWLRTVRAGIFDRPESPYARMFAIAGIEYGDLCASVRNDGLEPTLERLRCAGIYLTHDEYKGKEAILRGGREIAGDHAGLANPLATGSGFESRSSGSRSSGIRLRRPTAFQVHKDAYGALEMREFELDRRALALLKPILPASSGFTGGMRATRLGCNLERWFAPGGKAADSVHYRLLTNFLVTQARLRGVRVPYPTHLAPNDFLPPAQWLAKRRTQGVACAVRAFVSPAVRTVAAALDAGLDIRGTRFLVGGEALTDSKRRTIEAAGCEVYPRYVISEVGSVGYACSRMREGNCVHVVSDSVAVISWRRCAPLSDTEVDVLLFTPLLPSAPQVLINVDMGDAGTLVDDASCDCEFARAGLRRQIRGIHSYAKLTGLGVTLVGTEIVGLLERQLPERFGGGPTDFQLVEQEGEHQTELTLRVSPRVAEQNLDKVRDAFLQALQNYYGGALASRVWRHADALRVVRAEPLTTVTGKVLNLHLLGAAPPKADA